MADLDPLAETPRLPGREDYFLWREADVEWETAPQSPPPLPPIPDADKPSDLPDRFPRLPGSVMFANMTKEEQDEAVGPTIADAVRRRIISVEQLVTRSPLETETDFITQASPAALGLVDDEEK